MHLFLVLTCSLFLQFAINDNAEFFLRHEAQKFFFWLKNFANVFSNALTDFKQYFYQRRQRNMTNFLMASDMDIAVVRQLAKCKRKEQALPELFKTQRIREMCAEMLIKIPASFTNIIDVEQMYCGEITSLLKQCAGLPNSIACLVLSYNNMDPWCKHCDTIVTARCGTKNCYLGVHYSSGKPDLACGSPQHVFLEKNNKMLCAFFTDKCVSCMQDQHACYMCHQPFVAGYSPVHCAFPDCTSHTHVDCPEFENSWSVVTKDAPRDEAHYICAFHDRAQPLVRCGVCGIHELPRNEICVPHPAPQDLMGRFMRCAVCHTHAHVSCRDFIFSCTDCYLNQNLCFHADDVQVAICSECVKVSGECAACNAVAMPYPARNSCNKECDTCGEIYHLACMGFNTVVTDEVKSATCDDCWMHLDAQDTDVDTVEAQIAKELKCQRKVLARVVKCKNVELLQNPVIDEYLRHSSMSNLAPKVSKFLFYRVYCPWDVFDDYVKRTRTEAIRWGAAVSPFHSEADTEFAIDLHLETKVNYKKEPWTRDQSVAEWRENTGLLGLVL